MQHEKEQVALTSIAASAGLTAAKAIVGFATGSLALISEAGHSLIDLGAADHDLYCRAHLRQAGRREASLRPRQGGGGLGAGGNRAAVPVVGGGDLGKRQAPAGARGPGRRCQCLGLRRHPDIDRGRFPALARAVPHRRKDLEPRAGGRRAAFFLRPVGLAGGAGRPCRHSLRPVVGGFGRGACRRRAGADRRLAARPPHHRHAHRHGAARRRRQDHGRSPTRCRAWSRSKTCARARSATRSSSTSPWG